MFVAMLADVTEKGGNVLKNALVTVAVGEPIAHNVVVKRVVAAGESYLDVMFAAHKAVAIAQAA